MSLINGTYKLEKNENFVELLMKGGMPEDMAKKSDAERPTFIIKVDGKKINYKYQGLKSYEATLIDGETVEEPMPTGITSLSTTTLDGNVIKIHCKDKNGPKTLTRVYTFSESGVEVVTTLEDGFKSTRYYKRV